MVEASAGCLLRALSEGHMASAIDKPRFFRAAAACVVPFALYPSLVAFVRFGEKHVEALALKPLSPVIDVLLPLLSALAGFALLARAFRGRVVALAVIYFPLMIAGLLFVGVGVAGYAWHDYP